MSTHCVLLAVLTAGFSGLGYAVTVTNVDRVPRKITVVQGAARETHTLEQNAIVRGLCNNGCIVRIDDDPEKDFRLEGNERVSIENGLLFYDGHSSSERTD
ncbi:MAG: hypothetical protein ACR2PG_17655 [Hyphomicrobiaceae bacterium]